MRHARTPEHLVTWLAMSLLLAACGGPGRPDLVNLDHLDHLSQDVSRGDETLRIVRIYAEAPDYEPIGDPDEGIACVDDAARAAVLLLRRYELTGDASALERARGLLRFVMYMQAENGLFYNFVLDDDLTINRDHRNSRADAFEWWTARAVWALGSCVKTLQDADSPLATTCTLSLERTFPALDSLLTSFGQTTTEDGWVLPTWLIHGYAADATSELLLGLAAYQEAVDDPDLATRIAMLAEGLNRMQSGSMAVFPYGAHASWKGVWHAWGNAQTQALLAAGLPREACREASNFYPRWLVQGPWAAMELRDSTAIRAYPQIAYGIRTVALGLLAAYGDSGVKDHAALAGLAASWFFGNNAAGANMYDAETGRGFDGISGPDDVNRNAGAESTIEALLTIQEIERIPEARRWLMARVGEEAAWEEGALDRRERVFETDQERLLLQLNLSDESFRVTRERRGQINP